MVGKMQRKIQQITSQCSYSTSTVWYLLKASLLRTVFPPLKNVCFPALWFSVAGSRILRPQWKRISPLWKKTSRRLPQHNDKHVSFEMFPINLCPADLRSSDTQTIPRKKLYDSNQQHKNSNEKRMQCLSSASTSLSGKRYLMNYMFVLQQNSYVLLLLYPGADKPLKVKLYYMPLPPTEQSDVSWDWNASVTATRRQNESSWRGQTTLWSLVFTGGLSFFLQAGGRELQCTIVTLFVFLFNFLFGLCKREAGRQMNTNSQCSVSNISAARFTNCLRHLWISERNSMDCQL